VHTIRLYSEEFVALKPMPHCTTIPQKA